MLIGWNNQSLVDEEVQMNSIFWNENINTRGEDINMKI